MNTRRFGRLALALLLSAAMIVGLVPTAMAADLQGALPDEMLAEIPVSEGSTDGIVALSADSGSDSVPAISENARSGADSSQTVIDGLDITLGFLDLKETFPTSAVTVIATSAGIQKPFGDGETTADWGFGEGTKPPNPGIYETIITVKSPNGSIFSPSIADDGRVRVATQEQVEETTENGTVNRKILIEGLTANPNDFEVYFPDSMDQSVIKVKCSFTIKSLIERMTIYVPAPVVGSQVSDFSRPSQIDAKDKTTKQPVSAMNSDLKWEYRIVTTSVKVNERGVEYGKEDVVASTKSIAMKSTDTFLPTIEEYGAWEEIETTDGVIRVRERKITEYRYYPILTMGAPSGYRFDPNVVTDFYAGSKDSEIPVVLKWIGTDGQVQVHPENPDDPNNHTDANGTPIFPGGQSITGSALGPWLNKYWITPVDSNLINNITVDLPYSAQLFQQGQTAPTPDELQKTIKVSLGADGNGGYFELPLAAKGVEWASGVTNNGYGVFMTSGSVAELRLTVAQKTGFSFHDHPEVYVTGGPLIDANNKGAEAQKDGTLIITLKINISAATINKIEEIRILQAGVEGPVIGQKLTGDLNIPAANSFVTDNVSYSFPGGTGSFSPKLLAAGFDGTTVVNVKQTRGADTEGYENGTIGFEDIIRIEVELHSKPNECGFPVVTQSPTEKNKYVAPEIELPEGWEVEWFIEKDNEGNQVPISGSTAEGKDKINQVANPLDGSKLTLVKIIHMPKRIAELKIELAPHVIGDALSSEVNVSGMDRENETISNLTGEVTWEDNPDSALTSDVTSTLYGDSFIAKATLHSEETCMPGKVGYAFQTLARDQIEIVWDEAGVDVLKTELMTVEQEPFDPVRGAWVAELTFKVTFPKGKITALTVPSAQLQLIDGDRIKDPIPTVDVELTGYAYKDKDPDEADRVQGTAGVFTTAPQGTLAWEIIDSKDAAERQDKTAIASREYRGVLNLKVDEYGKRYIFAPALVNQIRDNYLVEEDDTNKKLDKTKIKAEVDGDGSIEVKHLNTIAKMPIDLAELTLSPPPAGEKALENLRDGTLELEDQCKVTLKAAESDSLKGKELRGELTFSQWEPYSISQGTYQATLMLSLTDETYQSYVFRFTGDRAFSEEQLKINIGEHGAETEFVVVNEEIEDTDQEEKLIAGKQIFLRGYVLPAAQPIPTVNIDISAKAADPTVTYTLSPDAYSGYSLDSTSEVLEYDQKDKVYKGTISLTSEVASGMNGGYVFRNEDGSEWETGNWEKYIQLTGLNDGNEASNWEVKIDDTQAFQYETECLTIPYTITFATENITNVNLTVPQPLISREPDSDLTATTPRQTRYRVAETTWERENKSSTEEPYKDYYVATMTIVANHNIGQDDGYYFQSEDWPETATAEDLEKCVTFKTHEEDGASPLKAWVDKDNNLIVQARVKPREAENEIVRLRLNVAVPSLSGMTKAALNVTQLDVLSAKSPEGEKTTTLKDDECVGKVYASFDPWIAEPDGKYSSKVTIRPDGEYVFYNDSEVNRVLLETPGLRSPKYTVEPNGTLTFTVIAEREDDIKIEPYALPASGGTIDVTPELLAAVPTKDGMVDLRAKAEDGYSLIGSVDDVQTDTRVRVEAGGINLLSSKRYSYGLTVGNTVTPADKADVTVLFRANTITLPRADGITVTVDGVPYQNNEPVIAKQTVHLEIQDGYSLRMGTLYYEDPNGVQTTLTPDVGNDKAFTFEMPDYPVEIMGRVIRPGEPDPEPPVDPANPGTPGNPNDPNNPSGPDDPNNPNNPSGPDDPNNPNNPSGPDDPNNPNTPWNGDDYYTAYTFEQLQTVDGAVVKVTSSGDNKVASGLDLTGGTGALARDLAGQYWLPDGLDIQVVDQNGRVLKASDRVATGHKMQLVNSRKHVLDTATVTIKGDVTGSGVIGISQLVRLAKAVTYEKPLEEPYFSAGDINGNGRIDLGDMVQLANAMIGK